MKLARLLGPPAVLALIAAATLVGGRARAERASWPASADLPMAPAPGTARFASLGYREAMADFYWLRALAYFGDEAPDSIGVQRLVDAIVALDPSFYRAYTWGGSVLGLAKGGASRSHLLWAAQLLERGTKAFPERWAPPFYAGQIYYLDLTSDDPAQVRAWQAHGADLLERALHLPDAPEGAYVFVANLRSRLGQHDRAVRELREMIELTSDTRVRDKLIDKLAELDRRDVTSVRAEILLAQIAQRKQWYAERPAVPIALYLELGPPPSPWFDLATLATPRDLVGSVQPDPPAPDDTWDTTSFVPEAPPTPTNITPGATQVAPPSK